MTTDGGTANPSWIERRTVELSGARVTLSDPVAVGRRRGYFWFPNLWTMPNGDLMSTISPTPDMHASASPYLVTWSRDGGLTWSEPVVAADGGQALLHLDSRDSMLLPYYLRPRPAGPGPTANMGAPYNLFPAGERRFEYVATGVAVTGFPAPDRAVLPGLDVSGFVFNGQTLQLRDGTYLATLYGWLEDREGYTLVAAESEDGVCWRVRSVIADKSCNVPGREGPNESAMVRLQNGRIMCVFRVGSNSEFGQTWSNDEGSTWTPAIPMPGVFSVYPNLVVMRDGAVALSGGRPGIYLWLNAEGAGKSWQRLDLIAHHNDCHPAEPILRTTAYTGLATVDGTYLLCMYDRTPNGWERIPEDMDDTNSVWVVRVTVERTTS